MANLNSNRKICKNCGRSFIGKPGEDICSTCAASISSLNNQEGRHQLEKVRNYIRGHQGASDDEVMENTGVSKKFLRDMTNSGYLHNSAQLFSNVRYCAKCGKRIQSGSYCTECFNSLRLTTRRTNVRNDSVAQSTSKIETREIADIGKEILIVDCDELNLNTTKYIMEMGLPNYTISTATSQNAAMNILHVTNPKLILLDDAVTRIFDGMTILKAVRSDPIGKNIKIMMSSNSPQKENVVRAFLMGVQDYLTKPFAPKDLIERVIKTLNSKMLTAVPLRIFKILIIEDNSSDLEIEKEILKNQFTCEILTAQNGIEGLWVLNENPVDLILVSLDMSFMDGLQLLAFIRRDDKLRKISVIIMSNSNDSSFNETFANAAVKGYVKKPIFTQENLVLIGDALKKRKNN